MGVGWPLGAAVVDERAALALAAHAHALEEGARVVGDADLVGGEGLEPGFVGEAVFGAVFVGEVVVVLLEWIVSSGFEDWEKVGRGGKYRWGD